MACAVADGDVEEFMGYAAEENLEATVIAEVTAEPRMRMAGTALPSSICPASSSTPTVRPSTRSPTCAPAACGSQLGRHHAC